jgi:Tfp pilus assembly protein PilO
VTDVLGVSIAQGGAGAILAMFVVAIMVGRLVPRRILEDVRADRDARLAELAAERDTWRSAHQESEAARHAALEQVGEMLELSRTAEHVLRALPRAGEVSNAPMDSAPVPPR